MNSNFMTPLTPLDYYGYFFNNTTIGQATVTQEAESTYWMPRHNASNNSVDWLEPPTFDETVMIKTISLGILFVVALVGNVTTILQTFRVKRRNSVNKLILQLAIADLIMAVFCIFAEGIWSITVEWLAGSVLCKIVKFMQVFGLYLSTYITVVISIDRCYAVVDPMSRSKSPRRVKCLICASWLLSVIFSSPQAVIFRVRQGPFRKKFLQCVTHGFYTDAWQKKLYSSLSLLLMFILPLCIMGIAYGLIFITIAKKSQNYAVSEKSRNSADNLHGAGRSLLLRRAKKKSLRITAIIVLAFIICWTPYYVTFIMFTYFGKEEMNPRLFLVFFLMSMCNAMVNPLIYGAFHICRKRSHIERSGAIITTPEYCHTEVKATGQCAAVYLSPSYNVYHATSGISDENSRSVHNDTDSEVKHV